MWDLIQIFSTVGTEKKSRMERLKSYHFPDHLMNDSNFMSLLEDTIRKHAMAKRSNEHEADNIWVT